MGPWLLVLDNVDDSELWVGPTQEPLFAEGVRPPVPLFKFVPRGSHGYVLITTRDNHLGKQLTNAKMKPIKVLPLEPKMLVFFCAAKSGKMMTFVNPMLQILFKPWTIYLLQSPRLPHILIKQT